MWRKGTPLASRVFHGVTGHLLNCVWNLWVFLDDARGCQCPLVLCLHPQDCLRRGVQASGSYQERSVKSGSSRMWPKPEATSRIPHESGLILRYDGKVGNHSQTKQGIRLSFPDQEGRRGSDEVVSETSVFPWSETGMSGNFWGRIKGARYRLVLQDGTWDFS